MNDLLTQYLDAKFKVHNAMQEELTIALQLRPVVDRFIYLLKPGYEAALREAMAEPDFVLATNVLLPYVSPWQYTHPEVTAIITWLQEYGI